MNALQNYYSKFQQLDWKIKVGIAVGTVVVLYFLYSLFAGSSNTTEKFEDGTLKCTMYYVNWCPACKKAKPEWDKVQQDMNGQVINGNKVIILKVDCDQDKAAAEAAGIKGYPTFHINLNGNMYEYNNERTFEKMKDYITSIAYSNNQ